MKKELLSPTEQLYSSMEFLYNHFNKELYDNKLPKVLFTNQRQKGVMGYFSNNRWAGANGDHCHEIAINPVYVGKASLIELMQTLVHEMAHCWQYTYGKPSSKGYHNKQWADKMIQIGLMPSETGKPGGATTGFSMGDYPIPKGRFIHSCESLLRSSKYSLPWVDRYAMTANRPNDINQLMEALEISNNTPVSTDLIEAISSLENTTSIEQLITPMEVNFGVDMFALPDPNAAAKVKSKYSCPGCKANVWGRGKLSLLCLNCNEQMEEL